MYWLLTYLVQELWSVLEPEISNYGYDIQREYKLMEKIERNYLKQYKFQDYRFYYTLSELRKNLLGSLKDLSWSLKNG